MTLRTWSRAAVAIASGLFLAACGSSSDDPEVPGPGEVFANSLAPGLNWEFFDGSANGAGVVGVDTSTGHSGASWKVEVPASGWVGGTIVATAGHDLSSFNALTFWAKASQDATLNVAGFGANQTPSTPFLTERGGIALTTTWTKFVIPIPLPARLTSERGLFHLAEGTEGAYTIWLDDIRYESLPAAELGTVAPAIATETRSLDIGSTLTVNGPSVTYSPTAGGSITVSAALRYFDWFSSDDGIATVDADGMVTGVAVGPADITARLGTVDAAGVTTVNVAAPLAPTVAAPTPTPLSADVISLFSDEYTPGATMAFWSPTTAAQGWDDGANVESLQVAGDDVMKFTGLGYSVSEIAAPTVDTLAPGMTHFHIDLWSASAGATTIKLVDYGANGTYDGGDDVQCEVSRNLSAGVWNAIELSFAGDLACLTTRAHVAQIVMAGANPTLFVDNVYFHK